MKYEDVQKLRTKYRQDPEVINVEYMRDVAVRCGNFKKAFELQEKLEDIWWILNEVVLRYESIKI